MHSDGGCGACRLPHSTEARDNSGGQYLEALPAVLLEQLRQHSRFSWLVVAAVGK